MLVGSLRVGHARASSSEVRSRLKDALSGCQFQSHPTTRTREKDAFTIAASSTASVCAERVDECCGQAGCECRSRFGRICL